MFGLNPVELRAFRQGFLDHALAGGGWPQRKVIRGWRPSRGFMRNEEYTAFRDGHAGKPAHARMIVQYLVDPGHRESPERHALNEYLVKRGVADPSAVDEETVYRLITVNVLADHGVVPAVLSWIFGRIVNPIQYVKLFEEGEEDLVRAAAGWVCIEGGRQLVSQDLDPTVALRVDEARMKISVTEYQDWVLKMWKHNRWSVVQAVSGTEPKGVVINIAASQSFYHRLKGGSGKVHGCGAADARHRSRWIVVEGMAPYPYLPPKKRHPGVAMVMAAVCQQARLSDLPGCPDRLPLNLLTFTATPVGTARAKRFGYKDVGTKMPGTDIEFLERTLDMDGNGRSDAWLIGVWQGLQRDLRIAYPPEPNLLIEGLEDQPLERPGPDGLPVTC